MKPLNLILPFALLAAPASAQIALSPAGTLPANQRPAETVIADLNGDGLNDLAVTVDTQDRIDVFFNQGAGVFGGAVSIFTGGNTGPDAIVAEDLNGNGSIDLAVGLHNVNSVAVFLNNGSGGFAPAGTFGTGADPRGMDAGDLEPDGDIDLAIANREGNSVTVLRNSGSASFTTMTVATGVEPRDVGMADFDCDGDLDLAVSIHDEREIEIYSNTGAGFSLVTSLFMPGVRPGSIAVADVTGDGEPDIQTTADNFASVFIHQTGFSFTGPFHNPTGGVNPDGILVDDMDDDGRFDIAVANEDSASISVLRNLGNGTFGAATVLAAGAHPDHVAGGDLNGDGTFDLAVPNRDSNNVSLYTNAAAVLPNLVLLSPVKTGRLATIRIESGTDAGSVYLAAFSTGTSPGITLGDGRNIPLNPDSIFLLSLNPANGTFLNTIGVLDANGQAEVGIQTPANPGLVGATFFAAFVEINGINPLVIGTISPALQMTVQS
jgi:hypothetical protein